MNDRSVFLASLGEHRRRRATCSTDPGLIAGYLEEPRGLFHGRALAVVRPGSTAEVAAVVAACAAAGVAIVPQGGNTGLVGGQIPDASGGEVILSLQRLKRIREIDRSTPTR